MKLLIDILYPTAQVVYDGVVGFSLKDEKRKFQLQWRVVRAYKHDGSFHREWSPAFLVEETPEYWALASRESLVIEDNGRSWITKEQAVFYLFKKKWANVIAMKKKDRICYYANVATPTISDQGILKYIDYDLDVKLYPNKTTRFLDEKEFNSHQKLYGYSKELSDRCNLAKQSLESDMLEGKFPFQDQKFFELFNKFEETVAYKEST